MLSSLPRDVLRHVYALLTSDGESYRQRLLRARRWALACRSTRAAATMSGSQWRRASRRALKAALRDRYLLAPRKCTLGDVTFKAYEAHRIGYSVHVASDDVAVWRRVMLRVDAVLGTDVARCAHLNYCWFHARPPHGSRAYIGHCRATHGYRFYDENPEAPGADVRRRVFVAVMRESMRIDGVGESRRVDLARESANA